MLDERLREATDGVKVALTDMVPPPIEDLATDSRQETLRIRKTSTSRGPLVAIGTAAAILIVVAAAMLFARGGDPSDVIAPVTPTTTTSVSPTTVSSPAAVVVPDGWDPILATTRAKAAPPAATCPVGTNPDVPGPVGQANPWPGGRDNPDVGSGQARPWPDGGGNQEAAFDRRTGRIILVDDLQTWTFDVCTNTWEQMNPAGVHPGGGGNVVYDADSDRTIFLGETSHAYNAISNTWSAIGGPEEDLNDDSPGVFRFGGAVYDPVSGLVLAQHVQEGVDETVLSAYDVDTDRWTRVGLLDDKTWRNLVGYSPHTDRLIFLGYQGGFSTGRGEVEGPPLVVDPRTGTATETGPGPNISGGFTMLEYAADTATAYVHTQPMGALCWLDPATLEWDNCFDSRVEGVGTSFGFMVGDPINNRLVLINPQQEDGDTRGWLVERGAVWAIDLDTGQWIELLAAYTP